MAGSPHFEVAGGVIDGVNATFTTALQYQPGTTAVFVNGRLHRPDYLDGWVETDPASRTFTLSEAPLVGDVVQVFYIDTLGALPGEEVTPIQGVIEPIDDLDGRLVEFGYLSGVIEC